jgi:hypothetical protein
MPGDIPPRSRLALDLLALTLTVLGAVAVLWAAAAVDWRLLVAAGGSMAFAAGVVLGREG